MPVNVLGRNSWVRSHSMRIQCLTNSAGTIQTILCVFISIQMTFWKHYFHFWWTWDSIGLVLMPNKICGGHFCADLPRKEIQMRQKAFKKVLQYGGKGLVYHSVSLYSITVGWLGYQIQFKLPQNWLNVVCRTQNCFCCSKERFFIRNAIWCALFCILAAILWVLNPQTTSYNTCSTR